MLVLVLVRGGGGAAAAAAASACWCPSVWYVSVLVCLTRRQAGGKVSNGPEHCNTFPRSAEYFVVVDEECGVWLRCAVVGAEPRLLWSVAVLGRTWAWLK